MRFLILGLHVHGDLSASWARYRMALLPSMAGGLHQVVLRLQHLFQNSFLKIFQFYQRIKPYSLRENLTFTHRFNAVRHRQMAPSIEAPGQGFPAVLKSVTLKDCKSAQEANFFR